MWTTIAENSALVLGLAISLHTIVAAVEKRIETRRARHALMSRLWIDATRFIELTHALNHRAEQVVEKHAANPPQEGFPSPAKEQDSLPEESLPDVQWIIVRAEDLLAYPLTMDMEKAGSLLNRRQIDALLTFLTSFREFTTVVATRMFDLKMYPRKMGVLRRFASVIYLNLPKVKSSLDAFAASLGLSSTSPRTPDTASGPQ